MPDQFTQTTTTGYGSRIINSIKGVVLGILLFLISFVVLYWNEGRVDLSTIAKTATQISSESVNTDSALGGKLISTTGIFNSQEIIGDNLFLKPDKFIAIERKVEMYAWVESSESTSKKNVGGSETTETNYIYKKEWTESVQDSSNFKQPEGHNNPQGSLNSFENKVGAATLGVYNMDMTSIDLPSLSNLQLNDQNTILSQEALLANENYIYINKNQGSTFENPEIGDLRVGYNVLKSDFSGTVFGKIDGNMISPYFDKDNNRLYRVFAGTKDEAIATLHMEYTTSLWSLRLIGFLMMWLGLVLLFGPISVFLDILPIFGSLTRALIGIVALPVALVLSVITILVSMVIHNIIALIIVLGITIGLIVVIVKKIGKRKKDSSQTVIPPSPTINQ
jgi:hypothetical protein